MQTFEEIVRFLSNLVGAFLDKLWIDRLLVVLNRVVLFFRQINGGIDVDEVLCALQVFYEYLGMLCDRVRIDSLQILLCLLPQRELPEYKISDHRAYVSIKLLVHHIQLFVEHHPGTSQVISQLPRSELFSFKVLENIGRHIIGLAILLLESLIVETIVRGPPRWFEFR